jgi:site-specific recombinase XerC
MNNSKIIDGEELKGKIGAFTQYLIDEEKSNSTIEGYRRNVKRISQFIHIIKCISASKRFYK